MIKNRSGARKKKGSQQTARKATKGVRKRKLLSKEAYELTMQEIESLMKKGEHKLTPAQIKRLNMLAEQAEQYEDATDPLPSPASFQDIVRVKLFQMGINHTYAAMLLGVSNAKFSLIMNGKQKPDIYFIKAVHDKLKLDANLILDAL